MIEVKNLTKKYGPATAVKDISFTVESGHIYGFLGPNGAGKSTTMNILTGCLAATDGQVTIEGFDIYSDALEAKRLIGYLPEQPPLYTDMTPFEYLEFVGRARKIPKNRLYDRIEAVMVKTGISDVADRLIKNLSKGYRQRVGIAQAILGDPEIVILDEPTVGLDPIQIMEIRDLIKELGREHTVILSSHILQEISAVCDYVIMISHGEIVASDTLENLLASVPNSKKLRIEASGSEDEVRAALEKFDGIGSMEISSDKGNTVITVEPEGDADIGDDIFMCLRGKGLSVHSMTNITASLEDLFLRLAGESLDAGAANAREKEDRHVKGAKKVITDSDLGPAYYDEKYEAEADKEDKEESKDKEESGDGYTPQFGEAEDEDK